MMSSFIEDKIRGYNDTYIVLIPIIPSVHVAPF